MTVNVLNYSINRLLESFNVTVTVNGETEVSITQLSETAIRKDTDKVKMVSERSHKT
jgi:hypothetical protein